MNVELRDELLIVLDMLADMSVSEELINFLQSSFGDALYLDSAFPLVGGPVDGERHRCEGEYLQVPDQVPMKVVVASDMTVEDTTYDVHTYTWRLITLRILAERNLNESQLLDSVRDHLFRIPDTNRGRGQTYDKIEALIQDLEPSRHDMCYYVCLSHAHVEYCVRLAENISGGSRSTDNTIICRGGAIKFVVHAPKHTRHLVTYDHAVLSQGPR